MPNEDAITKRLDELIQRQDESIRLLEVSNRLAALAACGKGTQKEKIILLDSVGFAPKAIADLIGTTRNSVSVLLSARKREQKGNRGSKNAADTAGVQSNE